MATLPDPSLIPDPLRPFDTKRLAFRAVRPKDAAVFTAFGHDHEGFINSSEPNISLPGPALAKSYEESVATKALLGAIIWLKDDAAGELSTAASASAPSDAEKEAGNSTGIEEKKNNPPADFHTTQPIRSQWGIAIGEVHLSNLSLDTAHHRRTELGITILPGYQGKGYGRETIEWALDYAFRRAGLHRCRIRAFEWNEGAVRLYEKIGFTAEGREREAFWHEGRWWDGVEMGMLDREWWGMRRERERGRGSQEEEEGRRTSRAIRIDLSEK